MSKSGKRDVLLDRVICLFMATAPTTVMGVQRFPQLQALPSKQHLSKAATPVNRRGSVQPVSFPTRSAVGSESLRISQVSANVVGVQVTV